MKTIINYIKENQRTAIVALLATIALCLLAGETDDNATFFIIKALGFAMGAAAWAVAKSGESKATEQQ